MLNQIDKKYLCVLIILVMVSAFTACDNRKQTKTVDKNIVFDNEKASNGSNEFSKDVSKNNNQSLDSWVGDYIFLENKYSEDYTKFYEVFISKENNNFSVKIRTKDEHAGDYSSLQAKIIGDAKCIDFIFCDYLPDETNTNKPYNVGDKLLSFTKTDAGISTKWGIIVPINKANKVDGNYFKVRKNSEGYIGHWYASIPHTGGNATTIEVKEMSNKSVSFHLYFCRTYIYDGINIKLENNIAKFVDAGGYKTSGSIEFGDKSIIVNIEKTDLPILKPGKTVFNYKVSEFDVVSTVPNNGATEVDLGKGIELDFDRRISSAVNPVVSIKKVNASKDSDYDHVGMNVEIEGNKLILTPDYDRMKFSKQVIEPGQKYELAIGNGQYKDGVGNINNDIVIQFTTKK